MRLRELLEDRAEMEMLDYLRENNWVDKSVDGTLIGIDAMQGPKRTTIDENTKDQVWLGNLDVPAKTISSLKGAPKEINGYFDVSVNQLTNLKHGPKVVHGKYNCGMNQLTSVEGVPSKIEGDFICYKNKLTSFEHFPEKIDGNLDIDQNNFTSLKGIQVIKEMNGVMMAYSNPIKSHVLGVLYIKGCEVILLANPSAKVKDQNWTELAKVQGILNKYLKNPARGHTVVLDAQSELLDAGLEEYAQL